MFIVIFVLIFWKFELKIDLKQISSFKKCKYNSLMAFIFVGGLIMSNSNCSLEDL